MPDVILWCGKHGVDLELAGSVYSTNGELVMETYTCPAKRKGKRCLVNVQYSRRVAHIQPYPLDVQPYKDAEMVIG